MLNLKIQESDLFHGAVLTQITEYAGSVTIAKDNEKFGSFIIDDEVLILLKYRTGNKSPWTFNLSSQDKTVFRETSSDNRIFLILVCGSQTICVLSHEEVSFLVSYCDDGDCWISISAKHSSSLWVKGSQGSLNYSIRHSDFPKKIFNNLNN